MWVVGDRFIISDYAIKCSNSLSLIVTLGFSKLRITRILLIVLRFSLIVSMEDAGLLVRLLISLSLHQSVKQSQKERDTQRRTERDEKANKQTSILHADNEAEPEDNEEDPCDPELGEAERIPLHVLP
ncbi:hypothetical protein CCACVL1_14332 [Corchorus capsularis]|uniref:Uncharacterized protein n=1 Tax=Corchorus capsularis TaxID=210143 RepID=A0A1R3I7P6_COCAP|nr:hypothetical protein CCACVL1_14332 [Corchorus capsularis]